MSRPAIYELSLNQQEFVRIWLAGTLVVDRIPAEQVAASEEMLAELKRIHKILKSEGGRIDTLQGTLRASTIAAIIKKAGARIDKE